MVYYKCPNCNRKHKIKNIPYLGVEYKCQCGFYTRSAFESRIEEELIGDRMKKHDLKIWPEYYEAKLNGVKPWEHRKNDRLFEVGDKLNLREWDQENKEYTGRNMFVEVTYIQHLESGYVIMTHTSAQ